MTPASIKIHRVYGAGEDDLLRKRLQRLQSWWDASINSVNFANFVNFGLLAD
jgi:hypothetical protein